MSRFSRTVQIFLLGVVIVLGTVMVSALRTPVYQGRSVARWLANLGSGRIRVFRREGNKWVLSYDRISLEWVSQP